MQGDPQVPEVSYSTIFTWTELALDARCFVYLVSYPDYLTYLGLSGFSKIIWDYLDFCQNIRNKTLKQRNNHWEKKCWVCNVQRSTSFEKLWYTSAYLCTDHYNDYLGLSGFLPDYLVFWRIIWFSLSGLIWVKTR